MPANNQFPTIAAPQGGYGNWGQNEWNNRMDEWTNANLQYSQYMQNPNRHQPLHNQRLQHYANQQRLYQQEAQAYQNWLRSQPNNPQNPVPNAQPNMQQNNQQNMQQNRPQVDLLGIPPNQQPGALFGGNTMGGRRLPINQSIAKPNASQVDIGSLDPGRTAMNTNQGLHAGFKRMTAGTPLGGLNKMSKQITKTNVAINILNNMFHKYAGTGTQASNRFLPNISLRGPNRLNFGPGDQAALMGKDEPPRGGGPALPPFTVPPGSQKGNMMIPPQIPTRPMTSNVPGAKLANKKSGNAIPPSMMMGNPMMGQQNIQQPMQPQPLGRPMAPPAPAGKGMGAAGSSGTSKLSPTVQTNKQTGMAGGATKAVGGTPRAPKNAYINRLLKKK